jgi:hypothetical protein
LRDGFDDAGDFPAIILVLIVVELLPAPDWN